MKLLGFPFPHLQEPKTGPKGEFSISEAFAALSGSRKPHVVFWMCLMKQAAVYKSLCSGSPLEWDNHSQSNKMTDGITFKGLQRSLCCSRQKRFNAVPPWNPEVKNLGFRNYRHRALSDFRRQTPLICNLEHFGIRLWLLHMCWPKAARLRFASPGCRGP